MAVGVRRKERVGNPPAVDLYSENVPIRPLARTSEIFQFTRFSSVPRVRQYLKWATLFIHCRAHHSTLQRLSILAAQINHT